MWPSWFPKVKQGPPLVMLAGVFFSVEQRANKEKFGHIGHHKKGNKRGKMLSFVEVYGAEMLTFVNLFGVK